MLLFLGLAGPGLLTSSTTISGWLSEELDDVPYRLSAEPPLLKLELFENLAYLYSSFCSSRPRESESLSKLCLPMLRFSKLWILFLSELAFSKLLTEPPF